MTNWRQRFRVAAGLQGIFRPAEIAIVPYLISLSLLHLDMDLFLPVGFGHFDIEGKALTRRIVRKYDRLHGRADRGTALFAAFAVEKKAPSE